MAHFKNILQVFIAGGVGGFVNSIALWLLGISGVTPALGFNMVPTLTVNWLAPRIIISGAWGLLFLLPFWKTSLYKKGLVLSLVPYAFMLFVFFPKMGMGLMGLKLGPTAPLFAFLLISLWGITAALVLKRLR